MIETQKAATAPTTAATPNATVSAPNYTASAQAQYSEDAAYERLVKQSKEIEDERRLGTLNKPKSKVNIQNAAGLLARQFQEPNYAVEGLLTEGAAILAGRPKLGKSWLALGLALAVASGGRALGSIPVPQGDVLYLALEDGARRLQKRMKAMLGSNAAAPERLYCAFSFPRLDESGLGELESWLESHPQARLIIIDTLKRVRPQENKRGRIYDGDYDAIAPLSRLANAFGVSIVIVHHTRKMDSEDPLDLISGSTGLTGGADGALVLKRSRGQKTATLYAVSRDFEDRELSLVWDEDSVSWIASGNSISGRAQKILGWLRDSGDVGLSRSEINRKNGGRSDGIDDALAELSGERLAASRTIPTQGRAQERWFAVSTHNNTDSDDYDVIDDKSDGDVIDDRNRIHSAPVSSNDLTSSNTSLSSNTLSVAQDDSQPPQLSEEQIERAAIMEFDGGLSRASAERLARQQYR